MKRLCGWYVRESPKAVSERETRDKSGKLHVANDVEDRSRDAAPRFIVAAMEQRVAEEASKSPSVTSERCGKCAAVKAGV
jgi:hypothetical protein